MRLSYVANYNRIIAPTRKKVKEYNDSTLNDIDTNIKFLPVHQLVTTNSGKLMLALYSRYLTTVYESYDDHAAILRLSKTYKDLSDTMSDRRIQTRYEANIVGLYGDEYEANIYALDKYGERYDEVVETIVKNDIPVRIEQEIGFLYKNVSFCGKESMRNIFSRHTDFKGGLHNHIYVCTNEHLQAIKPSILPDYRQKWNKAWTLDTLPDKHFIEIC